MTGNPRCGPTHPDHESKDSFTHQRLGSEDGWFASGRFGQVWEYGVGKLGFTVTSGRMISKMIAAVRNGEPLPEARAQVVELEQQKGPPA